MYCQRISVAWRTASSASACFSGVVHDGDRDLEAQLPRLGGPLVDAFEGVLEGQRHVMASAR